MARISKKDLEHLTDYQIRHFFLKERVATGISSDFINSDYYNELPIVIKRAIINDGRIDENRINRVSTLLSEIVLSRFLAFDSIQMIENLYMNHKIGTLNTFMSINENKIVDVIKKYRNE